MPAPVTTNKDMDAGHDKSAGHGTSDQHHQHKHSFIKCHVCGKVFNKILENCPFCAGLSDEEIKHRIVVGEENRYFINQMTVIISVLLTIIGLILYFLL